MDLFAIIDDLGSIQGASGGSSSGSVFLSSLASSEAVSDVEGLILMGLSSL